MRLNWCTAHPYNPCSAPQKSAHRRLPRTLQSPKLFQHWAPCQAAAGFWKFPALLLSLVHLFVHGFCRLTLAFLGLCGITAMPSSRTFVCAIAGVLRMQALSPEIAKPSASVPGLFADRQS